MNDAKWWLVCYDVHDPTRLRRCASVMEGSGQRMQHSVFRCWMTPAQMHRLRWELTQVLEPEDEVLLIPLCPRCVSGMITTVDDVTGLNFLATGRKTESDLISSIWVLRNESVSPSPPPRPALPSWPITPVGIIRSTSSVAVDS